MANLETAADKAVRDAVDAYMEGRLSPDFVGETVFETKNSRYRLLDGVVFAAPDDSLIGAELVGWLMETRRRSVVGSSWQPGARAVLVDRHRGRNIIVTSTTRLLHLEEHSASELQTFPAEPPRRSSAPPSYDEAGSGPSFSSHHAPILPATPIPTGVATPNPPARTATFQEGASLRRPSAPTPLPAPMPLAPPAAPPSSVLSSAVAQRRAAAVHLPPRPILTRATPTPLPLPAPPLSRPLPLPAPPPRRETPLPAYAPPPPPADPQAADAAWEVMSSEFEVDGDSGGEGEAPQLGAAPTPHDASRQESYAPSELYDDDLADAPESSKDAPIPLVRPTRR